MRKLLVGMVAAAAAVGLAPNAHAQAFIIHLAGTGISSADGIQGLVNSGHVVCDELRQGESRIHEIERLIAISAVGAQNGRETQILTADQASDIVNYASTDLCPEEN